MADPRTFTLIGEFKDGITPELERINKQLSSFKRSLGTMGAKGARNTTRDMGRLSVAASTLTENLKLQNQALRAAVAPMREYRTEIGKTVSAYKQLNLAGGNARGLEATNRALEAQIRLLRQVNSLSTGSPRAARTSTSPVGGGRGGGGGGMPSPRKGNFSDQLVEFGFELKLANSISDAISTGVMKGFQIGTDLMKKPFEWFIGAFQERVGDQISDLKAAGGLYAISKRSKNPFLRDIDDAIQFQQDTNSAFARMAGDLPGVTNEYVQVGKRLSDTAARIVEKDFAATLKIAQGIRATDEGRKFYGGEITGTPAEQRKEVIKTILGDLTKTTTLAGMGNRSGAGGVSGAYGLPGIVERILNEDQVSMGKFQRYASVFSDPAIADALTRNIEKINATVASGPERLEAVRKMMSEIVTDELIEKLRISVDGIYQGLKSAIMDPDSGLFGLSRQFEGIGKKLNSYGQYVDEMGNAVDDVNKAASVDLGLFEILSDIFSNLGQSLGPVIESIKLVFDPLRKIGDSLMDARHYAAQFNKTFNQYREGLRLAAEAPGKEFLKDTLDIRASFAAITNLLKQFNVIDSGEFKSLMGMIGSKDLDIGAMMKNLIDKVLNSDIAQKIGETIGSIIGTVISEVAGVTGFVAGRLKNSNKLFDGLKKGFDASGGAAAMANIFKDVWGILLKLAWTVVTKAPLEVAMFAGLTLGLPAIAQLIGMRISTGLVGMIKKLDFVKILSKTKVTGDVGAAVRSGPKITGGALPAAQTRTGAASSAAFRAFPSRVPEFSHIALGGKDPGIGGVTGPHVAPSIPKRAPKITGDVQKLGPVAKILRSTKSKGVGMIAGAMLSLANKAPVLAKAGKAVVGLGKNIPLLGLAFTGLDFAMRKGEGQDTAKAAGGAIGAGTGGALGAALGSAIPVPVVGTVVGGVLGSMIGGWIGENIAPFFASLPAKLSAAWESLKVWFINLPVTLGYVVGQAIANLEMSWNSFSSWWQSLGPKFDKWVDSLVKGAQGFLQKASAWLSNPSNFLSLGQALINGVKGMLSNIGNWFSGLGKGFEAGYRETKGGYQGADTRGRQAGDVSSLYSWSSAKGSLGDAIRSEMKNKPSGSDLVIANSSETVIPAAGGYGMKAFVDTIGSGFAGVMDNLRLVGKGLQTTDQNSQERDEKTNTKLTDYHNQTQDQITKLAQNLASLSTQVSSMGAMGGAGMALGAGYGSAGSAIAGKLGDFIKSTGGAPGSIHEHPAHGGVKGRHAPGSYHYSGRAIDIGAYANEQAGVIARIKQFNAQMGVQPVEFLHAGNDAGHQDHVHVAYAMGMGNPILASGKLAQQIDEKALGKANVKTYTAGKGEFGGETVVNVGGVVVYADGISDPDKVAYMVAQRIGQAVTAAESGALTLNYY